MSFTADEYRAALYPELKALAADSKLQIMRLQDDGRLSVEKDARGWMVSGAPKLADQRYTLWADAVNAAYLHLWPEEQRAAA